VGAYYFVLVGYGAVGKYHWEPDSRGVYGFNVKAWVKVYFRETIEFFYFKVQGKYWRTWVDS